MLSICCPPWVFPLGWVSTAKGFSGFPPGRCRLGQEKWLGGHPWYSIWKYHLNCLLSNVWVSRDPLPGNTLRAGKKLYRMGRESGDLNPSSRSAQPVLLYSAPSSSTAIVTGGAIPVLWGSPTCDSGGSCVREVSYHSLFTASLPMLLLLSSLLCLWSLCPLKSLLTAVY